MKCCSASVTPVLQTANPVFVDFSEWYKSILSLTFEVTYFNQKTPNDTLVKYFLPENTQDKMNAFDGNKFDFFVKITPTKN